jgi:ribose transport system permease protein
MKIERQTIKRIFGIATIPVVTFLVISIVCLASQTPLFGSAGSFTAFFRSTATVMLTTFALSINLDSGRFDFSLGAMALLSSVIGSQVCLSTGGNLPVLFLVTLISGMAIGTFSGIVYILVKLPPIIVSLGLTLFYEGMAFAITSGYGVSFVSNTKLTGFGSTQNYVLVIAAALLLMVAIFDYTVFGYEYKALLSGQRVSVNTGIREKKNAVICYMLTGLLMSAVGVVNATNTGTIQMSLNFSSITVMFSGFLPMFIGGFIGRFCNKNVGYLLGAATTGLISLMYARLNVASSIQQIATAAILVLFLIYLNNENKLWKLLGKDRRGRMGYDEKK